MSHQLDIVILREVSKMPAGYAYPRAALRDSVRWAHVPQPTYADIDARLDELERSGYLTAVDNELHGRRYFLTDRARAALAQA